MKLDETKVYPNCIASVTQETMLHREDTELLKPDL